MDHFFLHKVLGKQKALKKYGRPALISEIIEEATLIKGTSYKRLEEISDQNYITLFKEGLSNTTNSP